MRSVSSVYLCIGVALIAFTSGCTQVPDIDHAVETARVVDVVKRVKCDIYDAFTYPKKTPSGVIEAAPISEFEGAEWLKNWTGQVDLNLIVNDQASISPGVTLTHPLRPLPIPGIGTFSRSFTESLGGSVATTAGRTETITFTISVAEIEKELRNRQAAKTKYDDCRFDNGVALKSDLRLKEWVRSALAPAFAPPEERLLTVGHHKSPKGGTTVSKGTATTKGGGTTQGASLEDDRDCEKSQKQAYNDVQHVIELASALGEPPSQDALIRVDEEVRKVRDGLATALKDLNNRPQCYLDPIPEDNTQAPPGGTPPGGTAPGGTAQTPKKPVLTRIFLFTKWMEMHWQLKFDDLLGRLQTPWFGR
jgi:hypothetical protein